MTPQGVAHNINRTKQTRLQEEDGQMTQTPKTITAWVDRDGRNTFEAGQLLPKGWQGNFISEDLAAELVRAGMESAANEIERLRAALEPFSEMAGELFADNWNRSDHVFLLDRYNGAIITAGHFFDARQAIRHTSTVPEAIAAIVAKVMGEGG